MGGTGDLTEDPFEINNTPVTADMRRMAAATGARAPAGGADCDGDGQPDVPAGDPLVCEIDSAESENAEVIGPPIVNLVKALEDFRTVELVASDPDIVTKITPAAYPGIDFKLKWALKFSVTFTCPRDAEDETHAVELEAQARGAGIADATSTIVCRSRAAEKQRKKDEPFAAVPGLFVPFAAVVPPLPPPPEPVPQPNPSSQAQSQSQAQQQAQAQAQAMLAPQEQEQPQFAYAFANTELGARPARAETRGGDDYAMTSYLDEGRNGVPPHLATAVVGSLMAAIFAVAFVARSRVRTAYARTRVSRRW